MNSEREYYAFHEVLSHNKVKNLRHVLIPLVINSEGFILLICSDMKMSPYITKKLKYTDGLDCISFEWYEDGLGFKTIELFHNYIGISCARGKSTYITYVIFFTWPIVLIYSVHLPLFISVLVCLVSYMHCLRWGILNQYVAKPSDAYRGILYSCNMLQASTVFASTIEFHV